MPKIDHLVFAGPDLDEGVALIERLCGARAVAGGPHPGLGTRNALLTFDEATYFEIIAVDPDQPEPAGPRPFGLDDVEAPRLVGYAVHPVGDETLDDVAAAMSRAGFDPGAVLPMSRVRPDGVELRWRLTFDAVRSGGGALPFVIDWSDTPSPAMSAPPMGELVRLRVRHPDPAVRALVATLDARIETAEGAPGLAAIVETSNGPVELS